MVHLVGHSIEVPCTSLKASDFYIVFDGPKVLYVEFNKRIADTSSFMTTSENEYVIGDIIRKNTDKESSLIQVEGYGADDAWHYIHNHDNDKVYSLGYNL